MEGINWAALAFAFAFVSNLISGGGWLYSWTANRNRATDKDMRRLGERLTVVESALAALPDTKMIHKVELDLVAAVGELKRLNEKIGGQSELFERLEDMVKRHEEHLLSQSK